jgi:hypothetical protein
LVTVTVVGLYMSRFPLLSLNKSEWYPEGLVEFADTLNEMKMVYEKTAAKDIRERTEDYFKTLVGSRDIDPDDGLQYEVTEDKTNQRKQNVAYRQRYYKGQYKGNVDGPYHVADIYSYTKTNLDALMELTVENRLSPMARNAEKYSRRENLAGYTVRDDLDRTRMRILRQLSPHQTMRPHLLCMKKLDLVDRVQEKARSQSYTSRRQGKRTM